MLKGAFCWTELLLGEFFLWLLLLTLFHVTVIIIIVCHRSLSVRRGDWKRETPILDSAALEQGWTSRDLMNVGVIPRLHDQASSTSWLDELPYVSWPSQLDVCLMFARSCKRGISICSLEVFLPARSQHVAPRGTLESSRQRLMQLQPLLIPSPVTSSLLARASDWPRSRTRCCCCAHHN